MFVFFLLSIIFLLSIFLLICSNQYLYYDKKHSSPNKNSYTESLLYKDIQLFFNDTFEYKEANKRNRIFYLFILASLTTFFIIYFVNIIFLLMSNKSNSFDTSIFTISLLASFIILMYFFSKTEYFQNNNRNKSFL